MGTKPRTPHHFPLMRIRNWERYIDRLEREAFGLDFVCFRQMPTDLQEALTAAAAAFLGREVTE